MVKNGDINTAIADIEAQRARGENICYEATAAKHNVERSRLSRRCRGVTMSHDQYISERCRHLTNGQEKVLIKRINYLTDKGIPPTSQIVKNLVEEICQTEVDKNWVGRFLKRHGHVLKSGYLRCIANERIKAEYLPNFLLFFQLVYTPLFKVVALC